MSEKPRMTHASMPRFILWFQNNLLLTMVMLASAYTNGLMMCEGWVPNIEDPHTWGLFHGIGLGFMFAAGAGLGGLAVRVSFKLSECVQNRQGGRATFLAFGLTVLTLIEFWASFSQRAPNLHPTAADSLLPWPPFAFSATAILIAAVLPFTSMFWGFTAEDPAPKPVEDPATVAARLENERLIAEHKARLAGIRAKGIKAAIDGVRGVEEAPIAPVEAPAFAAVIQEEKAPESPIITFPDTTGLPENRWTQKQFRAYVINTFNGLEITEDEAIKVVKEVGKGEKHGLAYIAPIGRLQQKAQRLYGRRKPADIPAESAGLGDAFAE